MDERLDLSHPFQPHVLTKKAFGRLIRRDLVKLFANEDHSSKQLQFQFFNKLRNYSADSSCLVPFGANDWPQETMCFALLAGDIEEGSNWSVALMEFLLGHEQLWGLHPWLLCEVSHYYFAFFQSYLSRLMKMWHAVARTIANTGT